MLTSVQLSETDWKFCKDNSLKFSEMLREAINRRREVIQGFIVDNVEEERRKRENFQQIALELREQNENLKHELETLKGTNGI